MSLTKTEAKVLEALRGADFVSDEQLLQQVQGFSPTLAKLAVKETRSHTMAVRRLQKKMPELQIKRVRGAGFRLAGYDRLL